MARIIAIANQKGGVGKTTTSINLSSALAILEKKVLLIDADPQANATSGLGFDSSEKKVGTYELFDNKTEFNKIIYKTSIKKLKLIPSHIDLVAVEIELVNKKKREFILKKTLDEISNNFDFILIDCPPSLGLITLNALTASNSVIIPIQCEYFALEGLGKLLNTIKSIQKLHNSNLDIEGLLLTMYDLRLRLSNTVVEEVKKHFGKMVFKTIIQRNVRLGEAPSYGENIIEYDSTSKGAKNYLSLAQEILKKTNNE